jgi:hypothetical protein
MDGEEAPAAEPARAQNGGGAQQQRAAARSAEKAAQAPIQAPPHDPQTGEIPEDETDLLEPSASEAVKDEMISKLETIGKAVTRAKLSVWSKQNKPLKDRLQAQHKKEVELVFKALNVAVLAAEAQQEGAPA